MTILSIKLIFKYLYFIVISFKIWSREFSILCSGVLEKDGGF